MSSLATSGPMPSARKVVKSMTDPAPAVATISGSIAS
jgi:hypothetical protein